MPNVHSSDEDGARSKRRRANKCGYCHKRTAPPHDRRTCPELAKSALGTQPLPNIFSNPLPVFNSVPFPAGLKGKAKTPAQSVLTDKHTAELKYEPGETSLLSHSETRANIVSLSGLAMYSLTIAHAKADVDHLTYLCSATFLRDVHLTTPLQFHDRVAFGFTFPWLHQPSTPTHAVLADALQ